MKEIKNSIFIPDLNDERKGKDKNTYRVFPFAPGIAWKLWEGKYVAPRLLAASWEHLVLDRRLVVTAFGGILETFLSFSVLEALNQILPDAHLSWAGNFPEFLSWNGLAKVEPEITAELVERYPIPIFQDRINRTYFNCMNDYKFKRSWDQLSCQPAIKSLPKHFFESACLEWNVRYSPKLRAVPVERFKAWNAAHRFQSSQKFIMVFPDQTSYSIHHEAKLRCLNWEPAEVKRLADILSVHGYRTVVVSDLENLYYHPSIQTIAYDFELIFNLLPWAGSVLSREIDWHFLAIMFGSAQVISTPQIYQGNLFRAAKFFEKSNQIDYIRDMTAELAAQKLI